MLVVDPMKRLTVQDLLVYRWTNESLPEYLSHMKSQLNPGRRPDTLTSLLSASASENGPDYIEDIGHLDMAVLDELSKSLGVQPSAVRTALEMEGENAVKVAYKLIQDRALGYNRKYHSEFESKAQRSRWFCLVVDAMIKKQPAPGTSATQPIWIPPSVSLCGIYRTMQ
jgi:hypothetical protein